MDQDAPLSARRGLSTKLSRFIDFFEKGSGDAKPSLPPPDDLPQPPQSARVVRKDSSVKDIIKKFDPRAEATPRKTLIRKTSLAAEETTPLKRSHTAASVTSSVCSRSQWVQVDRLVGGKAVSKIWKRQEIEVDDEDEPARLDDLIGAPGMDEPVANCEAGVSPVEAEQGVVTVTFDTIGEEEDEDISSASDNSSRLIDSNRKHRLHHSDASKAKRASHFVAIRINNPQVVESVKRFQDELCTAAPFLEECKSNANKLHLTLLVLSLSSADLPAAKAAIQQGVKAFMKAKAIMMRGFHPQPSESPHMDGCRGFSQSPSPLTYNDSNSGSAEEPLRLDFRTIGAFGTRLLFLSPPLRQRLLLQSFHVELARAFGEHGVVIVGAGCGWNSAMAIKNQVLHGRPTVEEDPSPPTPPAPVVPRRKSVEVNQVKPPTPTRQQNATPLDKALLRHYDLSSARTSLYIPQLALFKVSKAAKRSKIRPQCPSRLKLFPRLYHNLVQRVLSYGLPPPRGKPGHLQVQAESYAGADTTPGTAMDFGAESSPLPTSSDMSAYMAYQHQQPPVTPEASFMGGAPFHQAAEALRPPPPPYESSPSPSMMVPPYMRLKEARRPVDGWASVRQEASPMFYQATPPPMYTNGYQSQGYPNIASVMNYPPPGSGYGFAPNPGGAMIAGSFPYQPRYQMNGQQAQAQPQPAQQRSSRGRDLKMITTSWLPEPPFGSQEVLTVELLEMSQMDADGYYKRLLCVELTDEATVCFDLQAQQAAAAAATEKEALPVQIELGEGVQLVGHK